ncbi:hypothetical protein TNCV_3607521 [Trichonephila clavipes]|nr:hypothetical protein TNCV_3607521 [Trichonephila clavipes]
MLSVPILTTSIKWFAIHPDMATEWAGLASGGILPANYVWWLGESGQQPRDRIHIQRMLSLCSSEDQRDNSVPWLAFSLPGIPT